MKICSGRSAEDEAPCLIDLEESAVDFHTREPLQGEVGPVDAGDTSTLHPSSLQRPSPPPGPQAIACAVSITFRSASNTFEQTAPT
jgi:hypothetical protein